MSFVVAAPAIGLLAALTMGGLNHGGNMFSGMMVVVVAVAGILALCLGLSPFVLMGLYPTEGFAAMAPPPAPSQAPRPAPSSEDDDEFDDEFEDDDDGGFEEDGFEEDSFDDDGGGGEELFDDGYDDDEFDDDLGGFEDDDEWE